ncbi:MAG: hypothetical protein GXP10_01060 [Gammaproteobacteria bacterium]|nr:hypothetical protein [Gammaproteobacteria bacterium]
MDTLIPIIGVLVVAFVIKKIIDTKIRHSAACNVLFAKHTFGQLKKVDKQKVHDKAVALVLESGVKTRGFASEVERYGWYALAMNALNMPSAVPDNPCWYTIKNPYKAAPGHRFIATIAKQLQRDYGVNVVVDTAMYDAQRRPSESEPWAD